jgi:hypothetical protein
MSGTVVVSVFSGLFVIYPVALFSLVPGYECLD